jgi:hypothetical protein
MAYLAEKESIWCFEREASMMEENDSVVHRNLVRDGGTIRTETASAAITGSDEARGVLSAVRHPS